MAFVPLPRNACRVRPKWRAVVSPGIVRVPFSDPASGDMAKRPDGKIWLSRVVLDPVVLFSGARVPSEKVVSQLHHKAHDDCFIANSVKSEIEIRGKWRYTSP